MNSKTLAVAITATTLAGAAMYAASAPTTDAAPIKKAKTYVEPSCGTPAKAQKKAVSKSDAKVRTSAQRGLDFLMTSTGEWQERNNCFGCHVQGVAGEALTIGLENQYTVSNANQKLILDGILDLNGGLRNEKGHAHQGGGLRPSSRAYGGAAIARYDQLINQNYSDDLMTAANDLLKVQIDSGAISPAHTNPPVSKGEIQTTYLAIQTWRQAFERSADERWLTAISNGERFLQNTVDGWYKNPTDDVQLMNYAMLGLVNAGVGTTEKVIQDLQSRILELQQKDGSWLEKSQNKHALTTGQTIYALRHVGMNDSDKPVAKGMDYLIENQQKDGGWSDGGSEKAAAMWAVLGLVATDVMSVNVDGLKSGQHVSKQTEFSVIANDNQGGSVAKVEIAVDDVLVAGKCGEKISHKLDAKSLSKGMHTVDVIATNSKGSVSKRRITVYAGSHYLTHLGTRFKGGTTVMSVRDIAPTSLKHTVTFNVFESKDDLKGKKVFTQEVPGIQGPISMKWNGKIKGKDSKKTEFIAEVAFKNADGKVVHVEKLPFVHESAEAQRAKYAEMQGNVGFSGNDEDAQNARVELLDSAGNVVQSTTTTRSGSYKFRNLKDGKKYRVRVKKKGFEDREQAFEADKAAPKPSADFKL